MGGTGNRAIVLRAEHPWQGQPCLDKGSASQCADQQGSKEPAYGNGAGEKARTLDWQHLLSLRNVAASVLQFLAGALAVGHSCAIRPTMIRSGLPARMICPRKCECKEAQSSAMTFLPAHSFQPA